MAKQATTVDEQIALLESRGMVIPNKDKAREQLLDIGYYRLGFYWYYFQKSRSNQEFIENTHFEDAIDLYYLDVDLRNLLSKHIYRIEVNFRTQLIYHTSNRFKEDNQWFANPDIVRGFDAEMFESRIYKSLREDNLHIIRHHLKYPIDVYPNEVYAPAWKTIEFLAFGQVLRIFDKIKDSRVKDLIANTYNIRGFGSLEAYKILYRYLVAIINIRNICSHSNVLFDYNQPKAIRTIPDRDYRIKERNQTNLNASVHLILYFLSRISLNRTEELKIDLKKELDKAFLKNIKLKDIIKTHSGFDI